MLITLAHCSARNDVEGEGEHEQGTRVRLMLDSLPTTRFRRNVVRTRLDLVGEHCQPRCGRGGPLRMLHG